jgi:exopolysaccharide production protein ExoQ
LTAQHLSGRGKAAGLFGVSVGLFVIFGGLGLALAGTMCALYAGIALITSGGWVRVGKALGRHWFAWALPLAFALWSIASAYWSPAKDAQSQALILAGLALVCPLTGWALMGTGANHLVARRAIIAAAVFGLGTLAFEAINGYALNHFASPDQDPKEMERNLGRGAVVGLAFLWPALLALWWETFARRAWLLLLGIGLFVSTRFGLDLNLLAFGLAGVVAVLALKLPRLTLGLIGAGTSCGVLLAPILYPVAADLVRNLAGENLSGLSYERRAQMWEFATARIFDKPLLGWGLDAATTFDAVITFGGYEWTQLQRHPHAAPLHLWLETGAIGAALMSFSIAVASFVAVRKFGKTPQAAAALAGGLIVVILSWAFSYGMWQEWLWVVLAGVIGIAAGLRRREIKTILEDGQRNELSIDQDVDDD